MAALVEHIPNGGVPWPHSAPGPHCSLKKHSLCHLSATEPQSPQKVTEWSEWLEMFRLEITYLSLYSAMSDQPRSDFGVCDSDSAILAHTGFERILKIRRI